MGEAAELILEGIVCQICGEHMGDGVGYPISCDACGSEGNQKTNIQDFNETLVGFYKEEFGLDSRILTHNTIRITDGKKAIDLFFKRDRYFKLENKERGYFKGEFGEETIKEYFKL